MKKHKVTLSDDGTSFFANENETILKAAKRQDVHLPYGCESGSCFGCLQDVTSGEIDYPDEIKNVHGDLLEYESMLCQGFARSDIILECEQLPKELREDLVKESEVVSDESFNTKHDRPIEVFSSSKQGVFPVKVTKINYLEGDVCQLTLNIPEWVDFSFTAGQYIDILLDNGLRRSFSIASAETEKKTITLYIKKIVDGFFSDYVFHHLEVGSIWKIEGPLGLFAIQKNQRDKLLLATGTGIVPVYSMLLSHLPKYNGSIHLYWGVRKASHLFLDQAFKEMADKNPNFNYYPVLSEKEKGWLGKTGYHYLNAVSDFTELSLFDIYISGKNEVVQSFFDYCHQNKIDTKANVWTDIFSYQH